MKGTYPNTFYSVPKLLRKTLALLEALELEDAWDQSFTKQKVVNFLERGAEEFSLFTEAKALAQKARNSFFFFFTYILHWTSVHSDDVGVGVSATLQP